MSLNGAIVRRNPAGDLLAVILPTYTGRINFNGGTPTDDLGNIVLAPETAGYNPDFFVGGLGYVAEGALVIDSINPIIGHTNSGLPYTIYGLATTPNGPTSFAPSGIPIAPNGRVSVIDALPPIVQSGFSDGFDDGFGATV